jgi:hypothetical protein
MGDCRFSGGGGRERAGVGAGRARTHPLSLLQRRLSRSRRPVAPLELALIAATYLTKKGYFGKNTHNGGMDKLGHAWTSFLLTELLAERMQANSNGLSGAHVSAAIIAFGVMAAVEVGDAYAKRFGFSRQDLVADGAGVAFALLRGAFPKLRDAVDFRVTAKFGADANPLPPASASRAASPPIIASVMCWR